MAFESTLQNEILTLRFSAPEHGNSLGLEDVRELSRHLKTRARAILVVSDHPRLFCSGGRLSDYAKLKTKSQGLKINAEIARHLESFARWPGLKFALVNGDCYGGGMEWLSYFDFRWCANDVLFGFWQRRIALTTGWGGGARWAGLIGDERTRSLILSSHVFGAEEALQIGIVERIVPRTQLEELAHREIVKMLGRGDVPKERWSARREKAIFRSLWWSKGHLAALKKWR